jgi:hypothetical protein
MTHHEAVEIKINVAGDVPRALDTLGLRDGSARSIWFLEDLTPGLPSPHPLLTAGLVLRIRRDDDGTGDSTVKLRPCRRSQLTDQWTDEHHDKGSWDYKIEGDWAGPRQVLAASLAWTVPPDTLSAAVAADGDPSAAFNQKQLEFLTDSAPLRVNVGVLEPLGPIAATRWKKLDIDGFTVSAERWHIGSIDSLELSIRVEAGEGDPVEKQAAFEAAVRTHHLGIAANKDSKTQMVLEHLAAARRQ